MMIDFDDPKWTAYVLGELSPEERRAVELELEASEELKLFVEELHIAAFAMKDAMAGDVSLGLTFQQRSVVRAAADGKAAGLVRSEKAWFAHPVMWAAAGLAVAGVLVTVMSSEWRSRLSEPPQVATAKVESPQQGAATPDTNPRPQPSVAGPPRENPGGSAKTEDKNGLRYGNNRNNRNNEAGGPESVIAQADLPGKAGSLSNSVTVEALGRSPETVNAVPAAPVVVASPVPPAGPAPPATPPVGAARGGGGGRGGRGGPAQTLTGPASNFSVIQESIPLVASKTVVPAAPEIPPVRSSASVPFAPPIVVNPPDRVNQEVELIGDNPFIFVSKQPRSTVSIDVDTTSYSYARRLINSGQLPPKSAVRIEEMINYFSYDYPKVAGDHPITANIEAAAAPWNPEHRLVRVGVRAKDVHVGEKPSNLVFLIDVSGSMEPSDRLPLLKSGLRMVVERLTENDRVTIVTYAGSSGIALQPTNGTRKDVIQQAIDGLRAEGSTNGGEGIQTAYDLAAANFIRGGINRVVLMTDGDFNVGITDQNSLVRLIEEKAKSGVFLSVLGVGTGNFQDATMERLANRGNGNYAYLDSLNEARKVLVEQMGGTLITVAKDVKMQVEFNPAKVSAYRLIGYEDRVLTSSDFINDSRDAGDMGAGHTVTALFEVVPVGVEVNNFPGAGPLRYQPDPPRAAPQVNNNPAVEQELLNLRIRYKEPEAAQSELIIDFPLVDRGRSFETASVDFRFAAAVAEFGMLLRGSPYRGSSTWDSSIAIARASRGADREGYREEFIRLVQLCEQIVRSAAR